MTASAYGHWGLVPSQKKTILQGFRVFPPKNEYWGTMKKVFSGASLRIIPRQFLLNEPLLHCLPQSTGSSIMGPNNTTLSDDLRVILMDIDNRVSESLFEMANEMPLPISKVLEQLPFSLLWHEDQGNGLINKRFQVAPQNQNKEKLKMQGCEESRTSSEL